MIAEARTANESHESATFHPASHPAGHQACHPADHSSAACREALPKTKTGETETIPESNFRWRLMKDNPPKTGRYIVCHRGRTGGDAFFVARAGEAGELPVGWSQMPDFGPTHWIDATDDHVDRPPRARPASSDAQTAPDRSFLHGLQDAAACFLSVFRFNAQESSR